MRPQDRPVSRNIVSHKLTEDGPASGCVPQSLGRIIDVSTSTNAASTTQRMQELLISLKRREIGKHPCVTCGAEGSVDCHSGSHRRQAPISFLSLRGRLHL